MHKKEITILHELKAKAKACQGYLRNMPCESQIAKQTKVKFCYKDNQNQDHFSMQILTDQLIYFIL